MYGILPEWSKGADLRSARQSSLRGFKPHRYQYFGGWDIGSRLGNLTRTVFPLLTFSLGGHSFLYVIRGY